MISTILESESKRTVWLYFLDVRGRYAVVLLFAGLVLVEMALGKALLIGGLGWLGGALALAWKRPADQEVDLATARSLESLVGTAVRNLDPREDEVRAAPLALYGPVEDGTARYGHLVRPRIGRDGAPRAPVNRIVILVPLEDHLGLCSCQYDVLTEKSSQVSVEEHHYRDVVSVTLEQATSLGEGADVGGDSLRSAAGSPQVFSLDFTNGKRLSIPVSSGWRGGKLGHDSADPTGLDRTIRAIRVLLSDKR